MEVPASVSAVIQQLNEAKRCIQDAKNQLVNLNRPDLANEIHTCITQLEHEVQLILSAYTKKPSED